jgi:hypothetical protein
MNEQEVISQRKKARANWELLQMRKRSGLIPQSAVDEALQIYEALVRYQVPIFAEPLVIVEKSVPVGPVVTLPEFTALLEQLTLEKSEAHKQMCIRSNQLAHIPDDMNAKSLVDEIQTFKAQRTELGTKIAYLKANGQLPVVDEPAQAEQQSEFLDSLPTEKYELAKLLKDSILPNLSKARGKLRLAKDEVKKVHYSQKIAKLETEAALIRSRMSSLS